MKFIFPQNYKFKNKIFGTIDYSTLIINLLIYIFTYFIINLIFKKIQIKIFVFIIICFPIFLFSVVGFSHENIFLFFKYFFCYIKNKKIYLYM